MYGGKVENRFADLRWPAFDNERQEYLHVGKESLHVGKENLHVGKEYIHVGKENLHVGKEYLHFGKENLHVGKEYLHVGKEYLHIDKNVEYFFSVFIIALLSYTYQYPRVMQIYCTITSYCQHYYASNSLLFA